jgi:hypothetical protein
MAQKPYYGLRLMSFVYQALAVIIAIFSIASVGLLWADNYLNGGQLLAGQMHWAIRALLTLGIGGLVALTCYVLSQLIDAQLETLKNTQIINERLATLKNMEATQADILMRVKALSSGSGRARPRTPEEDAMIRSQLDERAQKLRSSD